MQELPDHANFILSVSLYSNRFQKEDFGEEDKFDAKVMPNDYLTNPQPKHVFVYVCTIQRMAISILGRLAVFEGDGDDIDNDADQLPIPIHAFDAIIADECHRGYTASVQSVWLAVLDHFDALRIGLTATPASHTTSYFNEVVFRYTYEEAVRDGHLVDWDLVKVESDVRVNGVFLKEGETVEHVNTETGTEHLDTLEDEREFATADVERKVTSPDSNRKILLELKKYADEHEKRYGRFPVRTDARTRYSQGGIPSRQVSLHRPSLLSSQVEPSRRSSRIFGTIAIATTTSVV